MAMHRLALMVALLSSMAGSQAARNPDDLQFKVSPQAIVDSLTEHLNVFCRPSDHLERGGNTALVMDVVRQDQAGKTSLIRQRFKTALTGNNRTSGEGHLKSSQDDNQGSFVNVTVKEPSFSEEGVYTCRYIYMDAANEVHQLTISANVSVKEIPPAEVLPEVIASDNLDVDLGCACDEIWEEINAIKAAMANNGTPTRRSAPQDDETCRVSFSAKFPEMRAVPIENKVRAPFLEVISNKGGAYHVDKPAFLAPCSGQYFFTLTLRSQQELDSGYVDGAILVDGKEVARSSVFVDSPVTNYESASNGVVLTLEQGQEVTVEVVTTSYGTLRGSSYSIFSGFYISP